MRSQRQKSTLDSTYRVQDQAKLTYDVRCQEITFWSGAGGEVWGL